jgi:hypothetical protein
MFGSMNPDPSRRIPKIANVIIGVGRQKKKTTNDATVIFVGVLKGSAVSIAHNSQK